MKKICIAGAGPAGLAAAIFAARAGAEVTLVEKNDRPGLKLLATGGGRCNVTNTRPPAEWPALFGKRGRFITPALDFLPRPGLESLFAELGQPLHCPDGRHVFPRSNSARDIRDALVAETTRLGVRILFGRRAVSVRVADGAAVGAVLDDGAFVPGLVVLACGGKSYPATGSTWDGAALAEALGHKINPPRPGLVGLRTDSLDAGLAGLVLPAARATARLKGRPAVEGTGELLLTHTGVSGPAILDLSATIAEALSNADAVTLKISWLADADVKIWRDRLARWRREKGAASPASLLKEFLPHRLSRWLCAWSGADETPLSRLGGAATEKLAEGLGAFPARITETEGWEKAMVTKGGVEVREIVPDTMGSRIVPGLYFAGEMVDLDGPCGGYNLHWAFASGALAGRSAAQRVEVE